MRKFFASVGTAMVLFGAFQFDLWVGVMVLGMMFLGMAEGMSRHDKRERSMKRHPSNPESRQYRSGADPRGEVTRDDIR